MKLSSGKKPNHRRTKNELLLLSGLWKLTAMILNPMHHRLMLLGIVGNAAIEVRGKLDGAFSGVVNGTEAVNKETKSLVCFLSFPLTNRFSQECGVEFKELKMFTNYITALQSLHENKALGRYSTHCSVINRS